MSSTLRYALLGDVFILSLLAGLSSWQVTALPQAPPSLQQVDIGSANYRRLEALQTDIDTLAAVGKPQVGVALVTTEIGALVFRDADRPFVLASVAKLYILTAYLDLLTRDDGKITESDMALMQDMIEVSDNRSASVLWARIGGPQGLADFLSDRGLQPVWTTEDKDEWGTLAASPRQVAQLLWELSLGRLLDAESTQIVFALLSHVDPEQRWGISAGLPDAGSSAFLKNGWYPEEAGWRLNSAGVVLSPAAEYVLVVLTDQAETMEQGISLIEQLATRINAFMAGH